MSNSPRYVGFLKPDYIVTLTDDSGVALDLTGCVSANFTLTMLNASTGFAKTCNGLWAVANQSTNKGQVSYAYTTSDMDTAGFWGYYVTAKLPSEASPREFDPEVIQVLAGTVGASAAPPGVLPNSTPAATLPFLNIRDFGGIGDGTSDNTLPIFNARAAARALGGAKICYGPGTFLSGNQDISNDVGVYHDGSGIGATIIKLKNGANSDLFSGQANLVNVAAGNQSGPLGTLYNFGFSNMTLDGNKANQTSGPSYPLRFYGYACTLHDIVVRYGYSGNILADYHGASGVSYPSGYQEPSVFDEWYNVSAYGSGGIGIQYGGPNDSQFNNIFGFLDASHNMHIGPNANGATINNMHLWSPANWYYNNLTTAADTFARANQSGWGTSSSGAAWILDATNTFAISGNMATSYGSNGDLCRLGTTPLADIDMTVLINMQDDNNAIGPIWRYTDHNNFYNLERFQGVLYLQKVVNGAQSTIASPSVASINVTHDVYCRVQMVGSTIKCKYWDAAVSEPYQWLITATDTALSAAGLFGFTTYSPTLAYYKSISAGPYHVQSGAASLITEAANTLCTNCTAESSDTVQIVALSTHFNWIGGAIYDAWGGFSSGIKLGQDAGEVPFAGQAFQSGGVTTSHPVDFARINTYIQGCTGRNGAIWFDKDAGNNSINVTLDQSKGQAVSGTINATTQLKTLVSNQLTSDGTIYTTSYDSTGSIKISASSTFYSGSGVPASTLGSNGDFYFRTDTPGSANQRLYVKSAGSWIGII